MDAYLDRLLDELVAVEPHEAWQDVLHRARRSRRHYAAALAVVVALVLAPAAWAITHAFEGKPAPPAVKSFFRESNAMSARIAETLGRKEPRAIASKAHGVIRLQTADGPLELWAAPARGGGTCYLVAWQTSPAHPHTSSSGGCYPANPEEAGGSGHKLTWSSGGDVWHRNFDVVTGSAPGGATTVQVALTNGRTQTLPVVENLFLGALHQSIHWRQRPKISSLTARNARGDVVGSWKRSVR